MKCCHTNKAVWHRCVTFGRNISLKICIPVLAHQCFLFVIFCYRTNFHINYIIVSLNGT